jgi:AmmeMemoRadiSam system protein B
MPATGTPVRWRRTPTTLSAKEYEAVVLVGPSHRVAFRGVSIFRRGAYETPLGLVPVDEKLAGDLQSQSGVIVDYPAAHAQEHSLEIQLPFLQVALGSFVFVPLIMGDQDAGTCRELAGAISRAAATRRILVVASSDLSHFHGGPGSESHRRNCPSASAE